jgi:hypothetical protein
VHVKLMKPNPKAPGTERLKQKNDNLVSTFAFKFSLRRYTEVAATLAEMASALKQAERVAAQQDVTEAGANIVHFSAQLKRVG